ncbi:MAG: M20/M25/M40 family metallo-hydrolase [Gemmatimonadetes bacterium]|nr:M20/M25/M40 family metallo-hydrolase [Gemmatimonadota bacterium]MBI3568434.1 M20/M25/M40 family metallo-hydrolase [Gemmatimonadota bacterium]
MFAVARRATTIAAALGAFAAGLGAQEKVDDATIERLKSEEMARSQVMDIMSWLTDVHGPRLTGSPITKAAGDWAAATMKGWGLQNVHFETWGPFGRGWTNEKFAFRALTPHPFPIVAAPRAWSASTKGKVTGEAMLVRVDSFADLKKLAGSLKGKFLLVDTLVEVKPHMTAEGSRLTDEQLAAMAAAKPPEPGAGRQGGPGRPGGPFRFPFSVTRDTAAMRFLQNEGIAALLLRARGDGGIVFTDNGNPHASKNDPQLPVVHVAAESYGRIYRTLEKKLPVTLELEMANTFYDNDPNSFNVLAEIPGTDPALKDEVVMIGGHFDSWHAGTGATDNAAGSAVMMEAMRLLQSLGLKPRRTIRIGLWTGEEQGLLGSRAYVRRHFQDSTGVKPEQAKLAAYFNVDNGTGKIRGVYEQGNAEVAPIFDAWMGPFKEGGMKTLTISNTGGTDHLSYDAVGIPGFQFIQDPVEYGTRTHHSNADVYERIQADDMKWNAAVVASFAWQAAERDAKLPRKPAPRVVP